MARRVRKPSGGKSCESDLAIARTGVGSANGLGLLPGLLGSAARVDERYLSTLPRLLNNVPTYLGWIWMDFGWVGIVLLDVIFGVLRAERSSDAPQVEAA